MIFRHRPHSSSGARLSTTLRTFAALRGFATFATLGPFTAFGALATFGVFTARAAIVEETVLRCGAKPDPPS
jgi:hypothetical protein